MEEEELPVYGPATPQWLRPGGVPTIPAELRRKDCVVVLVLGMRTPADPNLQIKGTLYGIEGIAPSYLKDRRPWEDVAGTLAAGVKDGARTSGAGEANEAGTWGSVDDGGRFRSLIDLFLHHAGSLEMVQELIRGVKERTREELEHWGPRRISLRCSTSPDKLNIMMDNQKEAEKWEHLEELRLWMKHVLGLMPDIVNNGLGRPFFVRTP